MLCGAPLLGVPLKLAGNTVCQEMGLRGELQGCCEDRVGLRQILVMRGQRGVRPKAGMAKFGLILLNIETVDRDQSPSGSMHKGISAMCVSVRC